MNRSSVLLFLCCVFLLRPLARAQSPQEIRAFVAAIADGTPRQQREASKKPHPSHAALIAEAKHVNERGTPAEKAQFAFVCVLFGADTVRSRERLLELSRGNVENVPTYLVRLYDQTHDIRLLEALLAMRADGAVAEELADEETRLFSQRPALALRLITSDNKRFNQAAETIAGAVGMEQEGLSQTAFAKRKPFPQMHEASRSASPALRQTYTRFVAAAYAKYKPMGKPTKAQR